MPSKQALSKYDVLIIDQEAKNGKGFSRYKPGEFLPKAPSSLLRCYAKDLGFPLPVSFDIRDWNDQGILVVPQEKYKTFALVRTMSTMFEHKVFILWGRYVRCYEAAVEDNDHLVIVHDYPGTSPDFDNHKPFTAACAFLGRPKDMWRLQ